MTIVAGPPGRGKSKLFPASSEGVPFFNADDRSAQWNGGTYQQIPEAVRAKVNLEFEAFIAVHIERRQSFAFESTLRTDITFRQAAQARGNGFRVLMTYVALESVELNLERVRALREVDRVLVFDNSAEPPQPRPLLQTVSGQVVWAAEFMCSWLIHALRGTEFDLAGASGNGLIVLLLFNLQ